jgi:hypothetical protein
MCNQQQTKLQTGTTSGGCNQEGSNIENQYNKTIFQLTEM